MACLVNSQDTSCPSVSVETQLRGKERHACRFVGPTSGTPRARSESPPCTLMHYLKSEATLSESYAIAFTAVNCVSPPGTLVVQNSGCPFSVATLYVTFRILINLCFWREISLRPSHRSNNCCPRLGSPLATLSELGRSQKWSQLLVSL